MVQLMTLTLTKLKTMFFLREFILMKTDRFKGIKLQADPKYTRSKR